jgi:hypothetical protein
MGLRATKGDEESSANRSRDREGAVVLFGDHRSLTVAALFAVRSSAEFFMAPFGATTRDENARVFGERYFQGSATAP